MIRISVETPLVLECVSVDEAIAALRTLSTLPGSVNGTARSVNAPALPVNDIPRPVPRPKGAMKPKGTKKTCKKCGKAFPVLDRSDCAAVYCRTCRPTPTKRDAKVAATKAAPKVTPLPKTAAHVRACAMTGCGRMFEAERPEIVRCEEHRLGPGQNRAQAGQPVILRPVPAAGQPGPSAFVAAFPVRVCRTCGASVPDFETINGLCLECAPLSARKGVA